MMIITPAHDLLSVGGTTGEKSVHFHRNKLVRGANLVVDLVGSAEISLGAAASVSDVGSEECQLDACRPFRKYMLTPVGEGPAVPGDAD